MEPRLMDADRLALLRLARAAIADRLASPGVLDRLLGATAITPALEAIRAAFVTLREGSGALRGCIGAIEASEPLYRDVIRHAAHAAFDDPRFPAVTAAELPGLGIAVSALTPLRPVESAEAIVLGRDGVELSRGGRRAVFLPEVATEQGWSRRELLENLARKAGLGPGDWSGAALRTFETESFAEPAHAAPSTRAGE
jgi:AmmeMemoRadiSam system protein A